MHLEGPLASEPRLTTCPQLVGTEYLAEEIHQRLHLVFLSQLLRQTKCFSVIVAGKENVPQQPGGVELDYLLSPTRQDAK